MKTRTIYEILEDIMKDYEYNLKKEGNKIEITGAVSIKKLGKKVTYTKEFHIPSEDTDKAMEQRIRTFKEELKNKVVDEIKHHKELLEDDDMLIDHLLDEIYCLKRDKAKLEERVERLEKDIVLDFQFPIKTPAQPNQLPVDPGYCPPLPIDPGYSSPTTVPGIGAPWWEQNKIWCTTTSDNRDMSPRSRIEKILNEE